MGRTVTLAVTGLIWALVMSGLVEREIIPYLEYQASPTYRSVLKDRPQRELIRRSVRMGNERIGESTTVFYPGPNGGTYIFTDFKISLRDILRMKKWEDKLPGAVDRIALQSRFFIDAAYQLEWFSTSGQVLVPVSMEGARHGEVIRVTCMLGAARTVVDIPYDRASMLTGVFSPLEGIGKPKVGKRWKYQTIEPEFPSGRPLTVTRYAEISEFEPIQYKGQPVFAFRVDIRKELNSSQYVSMWVNEDGDVILEKVEAFGFTYTVELEGKRSLSPQEVAELVSTKR